MPKLRQFLLSILCILIVILAGRIYFYFNTVRVETIDSVRPQPLPDFPLHEPANWLNSKPLELSDLRGSISVIFVWTFD